MGASGVGARLRGAGLGLAVAAGLAGTVAVGATWSAPPAAAQTTPTQVIPAAQVKALVASAPRVDLANVEIQGDLDLTDLGTVKVPLRCTHCRITGSVIAPDVIFAREVDLDGVSIGGRVDLRGAVFQGPLLARNDGERGDIAGDANFSFASFRDSASLDGITFGGVADFTGTRFASDASFIGAVFDSDARFDQASFSGFTSFNGLRREANGDHSGVFKGPATFRNARFASVVDMAVGTYQDVLDLRGTTFTAGAALLNATVTKDVLAQGSVFSTLDARGLKVLQGDIDLSQAKAQEVRLDGATLDAGNVLLTSAAVTDTVSMERVQMGASCPTLEERKAPAGCFLLDGLVAGQVEMDLDLVPRIYGETAQRTALQQIEATERKSGNSDKANDAEYLLLRMDGQRKHGLAWFLDTVFYRGAAGYLVRPLHPLVALLLVILIGWIARLIYRDNSTHHVGADLTGARRATVRFGARVAKWLDALTAALSAAFRPKPNITIKADDHDQPMAYVVAGFQLLEYVVTKVLILVFFLCLANYNETLRQLIQGVLP